MGNKMLARYQGERDELAGTIRQLQDKAAGEDRDLTEAEESIIDDTATRIRALDGKMKPLQELDALIGAHERSVGEIEEPARTAERQAPEQRLSVKPRKVDYASAGELMCDLARSIRFTAPDMAGVYSPDAEQRVSAYLGRAAGDLLAGTLQTTADTAGLMPVAMVGAIFDTMDAARPLVGALGAKDMSATPGKTFNRPIVSARNKDGDGRQTAELTETSRNELKIDSIAFTKETFARHVPVSMQEIDWTSPSAWQAILDGFQLTYSVDTEAWAESVLNGAVVSAEKVATDDYTGWINGFWAAKSRVVTAGGSKRASVLRTPNIILVSTDMDASLGALIDVQIAARSNSIGSSELQTFGGILLRTPRLMLPDLPAKTVILGRLDGFEFYEQRKGFLQSIAPEVFGIRVGYGGYAAAGAMDASLFAALALPWTATTAVTVGTRVVIGTATLKVTTAGTTGAATPAAPGTVGGTVTDGSAVWTRTA